MVPNPNSFSFYRERKSEIMRENKKHKIPVKEVPACQFCKKSYKYQSEVKKHELGCKNQYTGQNWSSIIALMILKSISMKLLKAIAFQTWWLISMKLLKWIFMQIIP